MGNNIREITTAKDETWYRDQLEATLGICIKSIHEENNVVMDVNDLKEIVQSITETIFKIYQSIKKRHKLDAHNTLILALKEYDSLFNFIQINIEEEFNQHIGGSNEILN